MQNRFEMLQQNKNFREGSYQSLTPPPPVPRWDMNLRVRPFLPAENTPVLPKLVFVPFEFNWPVIAICGAYSIL